MAWRSCKRLLVFSPSVIASDTARARDIKMRVAIKRAVAGGLVALAAAVVAVPVQASAAHRDRHGPYSYQDWGTGNTPGSTAGTRHVPREDCAPTECAQIRRKRAF